MNKQFFSFVAGVLGTILLISIFVISINKGLAQGSKWTVFKTDNEGFRFKNNNTVNDTKIHISSSPTSFASIFFNNKWSISHSPSSNTQNLTIARHGSNGKYDMIPLSIDGITGKVEVDTFGLRPTFQTPPSNTPGTMHYDKTDNRIRYYSSNSSYPISIGGKIWESTDALLGEEWQQEVKCVEFPVQLCNGSGCMLKIKSTNNSTQRLATFAGFVDYNGNYATFYPGFYIDGAGLSHLGSVHVWDLKDNAKDSSLGGYGRISIQDSATNKMHVCGSQNYTTEAILIQF